MLFLVVFFVVAFAIIVVLNLVSLLISEFSILNREELSSYECGFEHHNLSRVPFSLRYFFLTLVFLLFDLEVVLMLFIIYSYASVFVWLCSVILLSFLLVLLLGLIYEWNDGTLDWLS